VAKAVGFGSGKQLEPERRMGEILKDLELKPGRPEKGDAVSPIATLSNLGITKKQSRRAQTAASVPSSRFLIPDPSLFTGLSP